MKRSDHINNLPDEILLEIFSYLSIEELALSVQHVNRRWNEISQDYSLWKNAVFVPKNSMTNEEIVLLLENMPSLKRFSTTSETKMKCIIDALSKSQVQIHHFDLHKTQSLSLLSLGKLIEMFPQIEYFNLPMPKCMAAQMKWGLLLGQCKSLVSLSFDNCYGHIVDGMLKPIANGCPSLQHISLGHCEFFDNDIQHFLEKKRHQLLSFSAKFVKKVVFKYLCECKNLEHLHVENSSKNLVYDDIKPITQLTKLKYFTLQYSTESIADNLSTFFLHDSFSKIVSLDLSHNFSIQDLDFNNVLKNFPLLKNLNISNSHVLGDEGLKDIGRCNQLESLDMSRCSFMTDKSVWYVSRGCNKLKHLNILSCDLMSDLATYYLLKCNKLKSLKLGFETMSGIYLYLFATHLVYLSELHIDSTVLDMLQKIEIQELQCLMPNLKIMFPFGYEGSDSDMKDTYFSAMN